jgi:hypothetical protein
MAKRKPSKWFVEQAFRTMTYVKDGHVYCRIHDMPLKFLHDAKHGQLVSIACDKCQDKGNQDANQADQY